MNYEEVKKEIQNYQEPLIVRDHFGNLYANTDHPYWKDKPGNPYLPLDASGNMQRGYVG